MRPGSASWCRGQTLAPRRRQHVTVETPSASLCTFAQHRNRSERRSAFHAELVSVRERVRPLGLQHGSHGLASSTDHEGRQHLSQPDLPHDRIGDRLRFLTSRDTAKMLANTFADGSGAASVAVASSATSCSTGSSTTASRRTRWWHLHRRPGRLVSETAGPLECGASGGAAALPDARPADSTPDPLLQLLTLLSRHFLHRPWRVRTPPQARR